MKAYFKYLLFPIIAMLFFGYFSVFMLVFGIALLVSLCCVYVPKNKAAVVIEDDKIVDVLVAKRLHWMGFRANPVQCVYIDLDQYVPNWQKMQPRMLASYAKSAYPKQLESNAFNEQQEQEPSKPSRLPIWAGRLTILGGLAAAYWFNFVIPVEANQVAVITQLGNDKRIVYPPQTAWLVPMLDQIVVIDASQFNADKSLSDEQREAAIIQSASKRE